MFLWPRGGLRYGLLLHQKCCSNRVLEPRKRVLEPRFTYLKVENQEIATTSVAKVKFLWVEMDYNYFFSKKKVLKKNVVAIS